MTSSPFSAARSQYLLDLLAQIPAPRKRRVRRHPPWDVLAYARSHPTFPCDSTVEQLYDAKEFEAYHQLGAAAAAGAAKDCMPPLMGGTATRLRARAARHNGHQLGSCIPGG
jgi:hypothetical protein